MHMTDLESLLRVPRVEAYNGFDLSPDGGKVAFAWNESGEWEIYELRLENPGSYQSVTGGSPGSKSAPKYSPDGRYLAYVVDFDGSENLHLICYSFSRQCHIDLTPVMASSLQPSFAWSPDSQKIAFLAEQSGCINAYVTPVTARDTGDLSRMVLAVGHPACQVTWSPNGQWLAVAVETAGQDFGVFIVSPLGGPSRQICLGDKPISAQQACWAPNSLRLAFTSDAAGTQAIGFYEIASGNVEWLTGCAGNQDQPNWSPDGTRLTYVVSQGASTQLAVQAVDGKLELFQYEAGVCALPQFTANGQQLIFVFENPHCPPDLWSLDLSRNAFCQLTQSLPAELATIIDTVPLPEEVFYDAPDQQKVPALLYRPKLPAGQGLAVIDIHGGPNWLHQIAWNPVVAHMVSRGWVVLGPNYRGSTGYGRAWQLANRFDLGGADAEDIAAGAAYLIETGLAHAQRIAVTGRSYGGYLTMVCLTRYPELWAAGAAVAPFLNWFTSHAHVRQDVQHWDIENFGDPESRRELWRLRSPFFFLDQIRAPVQFICGWHDQRCPVSESLAAYDRLCALGREVDLALFPDEGHTFLKIANIVAADVRRVAFLSQALERD